VGGGGGGGCYSLSQRPIISWLWARTANETRVLTFCSRSGALVCALHKHEAFALTQHVLRPYSTRNLDVARRIYNYRLTQARRMLECAFGVVCNKWRIFHCAIDVCPDFCDVIVKTCCILHKFVRQRDGFQCQDTLYECPLESIKAVGISGNVTGTAGERRAQRTGMSLRLGAWQRASLVGMYM